MKDIYLSIDIDYWRLNQSGYIDFLCNVAKLNKKIIVVHSHECLLDDIDDSKCKTLINVDYHSDLCETHGDVSAGIYNGLPKDEGNKPIKLNEGVWVNFVRWRHSGNFLWIYPDEKKCVVYGWGLCQSIENGDFTKLDPFNNSSLITWNKVERCCGKDNLIDIIPWNKIKKIGITTSEDWLSEKQKENFLYKMVGENNVKDAIKKIRKEFVHRTDLSFLLEGIL